MYQITFMVIKIPLRFEGDLGEKHLYALFDSGAAYSCISNEAADQLASFQKLHRPMQLSTASTTTYMQVQNSCRLDFYHEDIRLSDEFLVVPEISEDVIIGATTMQKWRLKLDFDRDTVIVDPRVAKLIFINLRRVDI